MSWTRGTISVFHTHTNSPPRRFLAHFRKVYNTQKSLSTVREKKVHLSTRFILSEYPVIRGLTVKPPSLNFRISNSTMEQNPVSSNIVDIWTICTGQAKQMFEMSVVHTGRGKYWQAATFDHCSQWRPWSGIPEIRMGFLLVSNVSFSWFPTWGSPGFPLGFSANAHKNVCHSVSKGFHI